MPVGAIDVLYTPSFAGGFDLYYTYMANPYFGFTTGLSFLRLNSSLSGQDVVSTYLGEMKIDLPFEGLVTSQVHCIGTTTTVKESYQLSFIEIPALLAIRNGRWYYDLGLKFGIPIKANADYEYGRTDFLVDEIYRTGTVLDDPVPQEPEAGSHGSYDPMKGRSASIFVQWCMEIGFSIDLGSSSALSLGAFFDYGMHDVSLDNPQNAELMTLNGSKIEQYNGAINSNMMTHVRYYKAGIRLHFNFGFGSHIGGSGRKSKRLI